MNSFVKAAMEAGFSQTQGEFMDKWLAGANHNHDIEDVIGLEEALDGGDDEDDEEEEE